MAASAIGVAPISSMATAHTVSTALALAVPNARPSLRAARSGRSSENRPAGIGSVSAAAYGGASAVASACFFAPGAAAATSPAVMISTCGSMLFGSVPVPLNTPRSCTSSQSARQSPITAPAAARAITGLAVSMAAPPAASTTTATRFVAKPYRATTSANQPSRTCSAVG
jgi:hypothetical protein